MNRWAKEDKLYKLLLKQAEGQYGTLGSHELEDFMSDVEEQIYAMTDEELDQAIVDNS